MNAARAAGYVEMGTCRPASKGAVGIEHANLAGASDQTVDVEEPESLLYMPWGLGGPGRRLVGVQYSVPVLTPAQDPPVLFGRRFEGPEPGPVGGLDRFVLRAWLFSDSPAGLFAATNPAEACDSEGLVARHGSFDGCHSMSALPLVSAKRVREEGRIPPEFRLVGEDEEGGGNTLLRVGALSCERIVLADGTSVEDVLFSIVTANVEAPDYNGNDQYALRVVFDSELVADAVRRGMGLSPDVVAYSPDLEMRLDPITPMTGRYFFASPDFELSATVTDAVPESSLFEGFWHQGSAATGIIRFWIDPLALGSAVVEVRPTPDTLPARLLCDPSPNPCHPIAAGAVATFDHAPYRMTVLRDWSSPRHNAATVNSVGIADGSDDLRQGTHAIAGVVGRMPLALIGRAY